MAENREGIGNGNCVFDKNGVSVRGQTAVRGKKIPGEPGTGEANMIVFNKPAYTGKETEYIEDAVKRGMLCGDGAYTKMCNKWMEDRFGHVMLTTSCTHALEMAAYLTDIKPGEEVIMPSYTFVSTADAFVLRGARIVFVDIRPDTMNIDEKKIEDAITDKTRVICPVHYAGIGCEMDEIMDIAKRHNLKVVEDAAQGVGSTYKGRYLGTIGDFGCYSFHETKNYTMGEGGAIVFDNDDMLEKAEILREKGTDRSKFFRGQVDKYRWQDFGSSYLPSELNAAYLYAQLERPDLGKTAADLGAVQRKACSSGRTGLYRTPVRPGALHKQLSYVLPESKGHQSPLRTDRLAEGEGSGFGLPLCTAPLGACRR